jgi:signal peptidase I
MDPATATGLVTCRRRRHGAGRLALRLVATSLVSFLASLVLWVFAASLALGMEPSVVVSDSMRPAIHAGDIALIDRSAPAEVGAVVAFHGASGVIVHRIVAEGDAGTYVTRGDANSSPDPQALSGPQIVGQVELLVPFVGLPRVWGLPAAVAVVALVTGATLIARARAVYLLVLATAGLALAGTATGAAAFTASASNGGSSLGATDVAAPTGLDATCGTAGAGDVEVVLSWTAPPTAPVTGYEILYDSPDGGTTFTTVASAPAGATTATHTIAGSLLDVGTHTYALRTMVGPWSSPLSATDAVTLTQLALAHLCTES